jgi:hypothetical protein
MNITRDHGTVVVIWLGHLERKMNLIGGGGGKEKKKRRQAIMEYIKGSPIGHSHKLGLNLSQKIVVPNHKPM